MSVKRSILLFVIAIIGVTACKNNDNVFKTVTYTDLTVVNASADTLNLFLNGTRQNSNSSLFPASAALHLAEPSDLQNYQFKKLGAQSILFGIPLNLTKNIYNSLYIYGESADKTFHTVDTLLIDTLPNIATIRFVHAAPDAGTLNVSVGDTVKFNTRPFKSTSIFKTIRSGQKKVKIYQDGAASPLIDTVIALQPNRTYTLFTKGLLNGKGASVFDVGIILNN